MSNLSTNAYLALQQSEFIFGTRNNAKDIEIRNAVILFRNLAGAERVGKRKDGSSFKSRGADFKVAISEEVYKTLEKIGTFSISALPVELPESEETTLYLLRVKVTMDSEWPPVIKLYTKMNGKTSVSQLTKDNIETADRVEIDRADIIIHPSEYDDRKFSAYLKQMNICTVEAQDFGGYWDELVAADDAEVNPFPQD